MNAEQAASVKRKIAEIRQEQRRHEDSMEKLKDELLSHAEFFDTYAEMYVFIRRNAATFEEFCKDMRDAKPYFDRGHEHRNKKV